MTKECSISIQGVEGSEKITAPGRYHEKDGRCYVFFEAQTEDGPEKCSLKFDEASLEYTRSGAIRTGIILKTGEKTFAEYSTPYGSFQARFHTGSIRLLREEGQICLDAEYMLSLNGSGEDPGRVAIEITASEGRRDS